MVWTPILSWSALVVLWDSGHIKAHKRCKYISLLAFWSYMIIKYKNGLLVFPDSIKNSWARVSPKSIQASICRWIGSSSTPTRKSQVFTASFQVWWTELLQISSINLILQLRSASSPRTTAKEKSRACRSLP